MGIKLLPAQGNLALDNLSESDAILIAAAEKHRAEVIMACEAAVKSRPKVAASRLVMKPLTVQKPEATKEAKIVKKAPPAVPFTQPPPPPALIKNRPPPIFARPCGAEFQSARVSKMEALARVDLPILAQRASIGDKYAQLELGIRFEEGRGVERDLKKARKLFGKAASDSGGTTQVYLPPVDRAPGRLYPVYKGPLRKGLAEAKRRLLKLEQKMEKAK